MKKFWSKTKCFGLYLCRWQLSTPIYAVIMGWLSNLSTTESAIIANLIGGCIFFWIDRYIFTWHKK